MAEITREQLAAALDGFHLWVIPDPNQIVPATALSGTIKHPEDVAKGLHAHLSANAARREPSRISPGYYDGKTGMQPFDVIDEFGLDFYEGNVVKYVVRWRKKGGVADLRKALTYLRRIIARAEAETETSQ